MLYTIWHEAGVHDISEINAAEPVTVAQPPPAHPPAKPTQPVVQPPITQLLLPAAQPPPAKPSVLQPPATRPPATITDGILFLQHLVAGGRAFQAKEETFEEFVSSVRKLQETSDKLVSSVLELHEKQYQAVEQLQDTVDALLVEV